MNKIVVLIKLLLTIISIYLVMTSSLPYYWSVVAIYWFLNFLIDIIEEKGDKL